MAVLVFQQGRQGDSVQAEAYKIEVLQNLLYKHAESPQGAGGETCLHPLKKNGSNRLNRSNGQNGQVRQNRLDRLDKKKLDNYVYFAD